MRPNWFVALPVGSRGWLEPLLADAPDSLRPFHPDDVHITVAFLGGCGESAALRAWSTCEDYRRAPIAIRLGALRGFGNPRRPSAISAVLVRGHDETAALVAKLRGPLIEAANARPDDRPPLPHVTIARPARNARPAERREILDWAASKGSIDAEVTLGALALYTWSEDRRLRQFRVVRQRTFGA